MVYFRTPFDKRAEYCEQTLKPQLKQLDAYMAGHKYVAGDTLTYVDFMFWEILDHMYRFGMATKFCTLISINLINILYKK